MIFVNKATTAAAASNGLLTGLESYYKLDEASGTIADSHGANDSTTETSLTYGATGIINDCIDFNGSSSDIGFGNVHDYDGYSDPMSVSMWVRHDSIGAQQVWCGKQLNTSPYDGWSMRVTPTGKVDWLFRTDDSPQSDAIHVTSTAALSSSTWYHLVFAYDGSADVSGMTIYIDGSVAATTTIYNSMTGTTNTTADFYIGSRDGSASFMNGTIDEVGIWSRELSSADVTALYNSGSGLAYSNFD